MNTLYTLLEDLKNKPFLMEPKYALSLQSQLEQYLAGKLELENGEVLGAPEQTKLNVSADGIATIEINGMIVKRLGLPKDVLDFFGLVDLDHVDAQLQEALSTEGLVGVILKVTSPGGFSNGVQTTGDLVAALAANVPVVVVSDMLNASAAFWISSKASAIVVGPDTEIGSVGVYMTVTDASKYLENDGIKVHLIKSGKYKAIGDPTQALTDEQKAFLQAEVNELHDTFKSEVNTNRDIADEDLEGQTFQGKTALTKGFADYLGTERDVLAVLAK